VTNGSDASREAEELLTPGEVAAIFRVNPKTVTRWHRDGKLSAIRTLGGHRRFYASEVRRLLEEGGGHPASIAADEPKTAEPGPTAD
jgi:excisionase family DNA binding protein